MRNIILITIFLFTLNCTINKVSNTHGFRYVEAKYNKIMINKTNKNDLRNIIGPPSSISKFGDLWYYIERKKTSQSLFKLGKKEIANNNILILEFNKFDVVIEKSLLNLEDMNDIKIADKKTYKKFKQDNLIYNILSTLREKVNAPTRKKK
tara:strand:- start:36 stop:488 length:453 start_codon:yes stop_codon:yes gene_type:complete